MSALAAFGAQAEQEGLTLVRCAGGATGFKCVSVKTSGFYPLLRVGTTSKPGRAAKPGLLGPRCDTPEEAALVLARHRGWVVGTKCDCHRCKAASCPPVAAPPTKSEVEDKATAEGLTLAKADSCSGYKHISHRFPFVIKPKKLAALRSASTNFVEPPYSFATGHEAALALARLLGPARSAEEAVVMMPLTAEEVATRLMQTDNGEAFGGLFGGWTCVGYLTPAPTPNPTPTPTPTPTPIPLPLTPNP
jgi:hypothetical protein